MGIGIISFDRPQYLRQLLKSLEKQDLVDTEFHLFQDGEVNKFSKRQVTVHGLTRKCIKLFNEAELPNKFIHDRKVNVGNAINQFEAIEFMSDNYDKFLIIEDDVVLSPHYIRLVKLLGKKINNDVFSVGLGFKRLCKKENIDYNLTRLVTSNDRVGNSIHWWCELYSSKNWKKVRKDFLEYYKFVKDVDYKMRPSDEIRKFFHSQGFNINQTSQDAGRDYALFKNGMIRLNTVVNRGIYIGEYGLHFTPNKFKLGGYDKQYPYIHRMDSKLKEFEL